MPLLPALIMKDIETNLRITVEDLCKPLELTPVFMYPL